MSKTLEYAIYKGDDFIMIGTIYEISNKLGISPQSVEFYGRPAHHKRVGNNGLVAVPLRDEEE
jgi:hypothetical protein